MKPQLPPTIEKYVRATNSHDAASFISAHYFAIKDDKIVRLRCQLADEKKGK